MPRSATSHVAFGIRDAVLGGPLLVQPVGSSYVWKVLLRRLENGDLPEGYLSLEREGIEHVPVC